MDGNAPAPLRSLELEELPACPLCAGKARRDLGPVAYGRSPIEFSGERIDISTLRPRLLECPACRARWTSPVLSPQAAQELYARSRPTRWANATARFESTFRKAGLSLPQGPGRVLDYGCFTGDLLGCFQRRGWETFGVDLCEAAIAVARERGHVARSGGAEAVRELPGPFDLITLFDVIEHLTDPRPLLRELAAALRPGGQLWILTGDAGCRAARLLGADWWYVSFPEHVVFYREENLRAVLEPAGLRLEGVARLRYLDQPARVVARNYAAAAVYAALHPLAAERTQLRLGAGPPPLLPSVDHLLVRAVRADSARG